MSRVVAIFKTLRNHWKKSTVAACLLGYGSWYLNERNRTNMMMRAFCEHAKAYGDEPLASGAKPRHITVIVNPTARDGKGKTLYEKYAAPLFHLAGIRVSYFQTEYAGQSKSLMEVLENTDAVVIVGGDGTLHEAVTGIMSREDYVAACKQYPVGIIPSGKTNMVAKTLLWEEGMNEARWIASSAMAVISERLSKLDVVKVELTKGVEAESDADGIEEPKVVYALGRLEEGAFRDVRSTIPKYWYFGPLKTRAAFFFGALKEKPETTVAKLSYCEPCSGCSRCFNAENDEKRPNVNRRWWSSLIARSPPRAAGPQVDYSKQINEDCGVRHHRTVEHCQLDMLINSQKGHHALKLSASQPAQGRMQFFSDSLQRHLHGTYKLQGTEELLAREVDLDFWRPDAQEGCGQLCTRTVSIDSVEYQAQKLSLKLIPSVLNVYSARDA